MQYIVAALLRELLKMSLFALHAHVYSKHSITKLLRNKSLLQVSFLISFKVSYHGGVAENLPIVIISASHHHQIFETSQPSTVEETSQCCLQKCNNNNNNDDNNAV